MKEGQKYCFKIAIIGDSQVGKSSLMKNFTISSFDGDYGKTLGVQISLFDSEIKGNMIRLLLWDIAGRDDYNKLYLQHSKKTNAAILVFSLEDNELGKESFNHILEWHREVLKNCGKIPIYIIGNKVDLAEENKLDESKIKHLVEENNFRGYYLTSAISGSRIVKLFKVISEDLYKKYKV